MRIRHSGIGHLLFFVYYLQLRLCEASMNLDNSFAAASRSWSFWIIQFACFRFSERGNWWFSRFCNSADDQPRFWVTLFKRCSKRHSINTIWSHNSFQPASKIQPHQSGLHRLFPLFWPTKISCSSRRWISGWTSASSFSNDSWCCFPSPKTILASCERTMVPCSLNTADPNCSRIFCCNSGKSSTSCPIWSASITLTDRKDLTLFATALLPDPIPPIRAIVGMSLWQDTRRFWQLALVEKWFSYTILRIRTYHTGGLWLLNP